jgi:1-acyl-sn-glycerol-3-phosphate acyltransferase
MSKHVAKPRKAARGAAAPGARRSRAAGDAAEPGSVVAFTPATPEEMRRLFTVARAYFNPEFLGLWELDLDKPALWVGNHTLFGLTDAPLMVEHLYTQYGVMLRGLGDRGHFAVPYWGDMLVRNGMVLGTPENCSALMKAGAHVVVFPGGGREVMRRKGEAYRLVWKQRTGFARMAIEHGYDIIPFGSVGPDEAFDILLDANDVMASPLWKQLAERFKLAERTRGGDMIPPIVRGIGLTLIPRPQRYYFGFGQRISTKRLKGKADNARTLWALRERVARAIEGQIERLLVYREEDRLQHWSVLRRWLAPLKRRN